MEGRKLYLIIKRGLFNLRDIKNAIIIISNTCLIIFSVSYYYLLVMYSLIIFLCRMTFSKSIRYIPRHHYYCVDQNTTAQYLVADSIYSWESNPSEFLD